MSNTGDRFTVNEKDVTAKVIDGEAIIINLANGMYYSLDQTGAVAWVLLGAGHSVDEAADALAERFGVEADTARTDLAKLVNDLKEQNLIVSVDGSAAPRAVELEPPTGDPYETPVLNSYNDMGDVLALDPPLPQVEIENETWETPQA